MKTSTKFQKIVKAIENYRHVSDDCFIEKSANNDRIKLVSGTSDMIFGYMISFVLELCAKYNMNYYFSSTIGTRKPCICIYESKM